MVLAVGDKDDVRDTRIPGYVMVNLAAGYRINDNFRVFARLDNVFDKKYQQSYGYGTSRIAGYGGVEVSF